MSEKNLYDFSNEELKEKFNKDFIKTYSKVYYNDDNWELMNKIVNDFNDSILNTNFPLALYNETKYKLAQVPSTKKEQALSQKIVDNIINVFGKVGNSISTFFSSTSFIFSIFGLTVVSIVASLLINLLFINFLYSILPSTFTSTVVKSFVSAIIFIGLKIYLLIEKNDKDILYDYKTDLIKFACTIPFYGLVLYLFNIIPFLQPFSYEIYPFLWLSTFTNEYVISSIISLIINCLLIIIIFLFIRKKSEK